MHFIHCVIEVKSTFVPYKARQIAESSAKVTK